MAISSTVSVKSFDTKRATTKYTTATRPSGNLKTTGQFTWRHKSQIWKFNSNPKLAVNFTFQQIYFSSCSSTKCFFGNMTAKANASKQVRNFVNCGPSACDVDIVLQARYFVFCQIFLSFTIIDSNMFQSVLFDTKTQSSNQNMWFRCYQSSTPGALSSLH